MVGDAGEQWGEDPGWRPSLVFLIPYAVFFRRTRRDPITLIRILYLTFLTALVLYGYVLLFITPFRSEHDGLGWIIGIGAVAAVNLVLVRRVERPLPCESDAMLAGAFRARLFLRIAFAETPALFGFTAAFVTDSNWVFYLCVLFSLPALVRAAPTRAALIRDQDELTARGCNLSLVAALRSTPPKPK